MKNIDDFSLATAKPVKHRTCFMFLLTMGEVMSTIFDKFRGPRCMGLGTNQRASWAKSEGCVGYFNKLINRHTVGCRSID